MKPILLICAALLPLLLGQAPAAAQQTVTGLVTSAETLAPLNGVLVSVEDGNTAVLTNSAGRYTISAPANGVLVFSLLGYGTERVEIAGQTTLNVTLDVTALALDEIVAVGYATQSRATVSGAVSTVAAEELERTSSTTTADALVGTMAGINTRMSTGGSTYSNRQPLDGRPGAATALQIRNMGEPLFVIDGVPQTALEFNQLNPNDISNISILKDASASVYGFRAANGVVLVTTKRGSELRTPQVNLSGYYGWQNLARGRSPFGYANTSGQFMYSIVESQQNRGEERTISREELDRWIQGGPGYETHETWNRIINNPNAMQLNGNASISGGAENATYYLSLGHVNQDYVIKDNNFNRTNLQANLQSELFDGITVGTELRGRLENHTNIAITEESDPIRLAFKSIQSTWPHEDPYANGNPNYINGDVRYIVRSPAIFSRDVSGTQDQVRQNFTGNFWVEYALPFGPVAKATYSRTADVEEFDIHRYTYDAYCYDAATDTYEVCYQYKGQKRQSLRGNRTSSFANVQVTHSMELGPHSLSGVGAIEITGGEGTVTQLTSVPPTNFNPLIDFVDVNDAETEWMIERRASYVGRLNYDYDQKYLVEALGRYDGSYLYAPGKRWGFFPGFSVGWRITEEPFLRDRFSFLNELKLRASWGQAGREQASPWDYLGGATYGAGSARFDQGVVTGIEPRGLPAVNLSWVTSTTRNVGVDFAIFDRKLAGQIDLFERRLSGLPAARYDVLLPDEVGYLLPEENLESEANLGIDGMVTYTDRIGGLTYSVSPNVTLSRHKILSRYKPRYGNSWLEYRTATENRWSQVNFSYHAIGQFQSVEEILKYPVDLDGQGNRSLLPGDLIYEDVNGDLVIDELDQRPVAFARSGTPILSFGLNGSFDYRGFNLSYSLAGASMFSYRPGDDLQIPYNSDHIGGAYIWSRWRRVDPYDDNSEWIPGKYPPLRKSQGSHSSYRDSDFNDVRVRYLRVRRLELGYTVPPDLISRFSFSNLRVYASATNPYVLDNVGHWGSDPESANCCGQFYPPANVVSVGFSASLGGVPRAGTAVSVPVDSDD